MNRVHLGLLVLGRRPVTRAVELARYCEAAGFDAFWIPDERFFRDTYVLAAIVAQGTQRLAIGPCVTDPYTRHPVITAASIATLDELSGGRAQLAIGAGYAGFRALGLSQPHPADAVAEVTDLIRRLIAGERVEVRGKVIAFDGALDFAPPRRTVPIYIAAGGPRMLEVAGRLGDAVIIQACMATLEIEEALAHVRKGARDGGRLQGTPDLVARVDVAVDESLDRAYEALKPRVARILLRQSPHFTRFRKLGMDVPAHLAEMTRDVGYTHDPQVLGRIADHVPHNYVDAFCVAATPETLRGRMAVLLAYGFRQIIVDPIPTDNDRVEGVVDSIAVWRGALALDP